MAVTIFNVDIPFRDRCKQVLGGKVDVFPVSKFEDVALPCVQIVRESADIIPNSGAEPHYDCKMHLMCYSTDYDEGVAIAASLIKSFDGVTLSYEDEDGSRILAKCLRTNAGVEGMDANAFYQEIIVDCKVTVKN